MKMYVKNSPGFVRSLLLAGFCLFSLPVEAGERSNVHPVAESGMTALRSEALRNWKKGRFTDALRKLESMAEEQPDEAQHRLALGLCLRRQERYTEALESYQDAKDLGGPEGLISLLEAEIHGIRDERDRVFSSLRKAAQGGRNIIKDVQGLPSLSPYGSDTGFVQLALQLETFELPRLRGRDPFSGSFPLAAVEHPRGVEKSPGKKVEEGAVTQAEAVDAFRELVERIRAALADGDEASAMTAWIQVEKSGVNEVAISLPRHRREYRNIRGRLAALGPRMKSVRLRYHYQEAVAGLARLQGSFDRGNYDEIEGLSLGIFADSEKLQALASDYAPVAGELLRRVRELVRRSRIRMEFESRKPTVKGVLIGGGGKGLAVIDGRSLKPGDSISEFLLLEVASDRVKFAYKGEEIPVFLAGNRENNKGVDHD